MITDAWVVWVWEFLGVDWVLGGGGSVGVPGGVATIAAGLVLTGGLVGVGAVVGLWLWGWGLMPLPSVDTEELWSSVLEVHVGEVLKDLLVVVLVGLLVWDWLVELVVLVGTGWHILVESGGGGNTNEGSNGKFHLKIKIYYLNPTT